MTKKTIGRHEIIESLSREGGLTAPQSSEVLESVLEVITLGLVKEGQVKLSSFGSFEVLSKNARLARNPKTKEEVMLDPRKSLSFRASQLLKDRTAG